MNILFLGDIVGRSGREAISKHLPRLRRELTLDAVIANCDNAAHGFGVEPKIAEDLFAGGVDLLTGGDHLWDQKGIIPYLEKEKRLLRPLNFPDGAPGQGIGFIETPKGKLAVIHLQGQVFMRDYLDCPFAAADRALARIRLGQEAKAILVDIHAEATSEKMAMGLHCDGRASLVVGSHTHVPTADARVLPRKTAYHTDAGMCGDYNSVIGFDPEGPLATFRTKLRKVRRAPASGEGTLCGTFVETSAATGLAVRVAGVRVGGALDAPLT